MFKSFNTVWLKQALILLSGSGWTPFVLAVVSLCVCGLYGGSAFLTWWLAASAVVLIGFSIFLGELPYQLIKPEMHISRYAYFWSWVFWGAGIIVIALIPVFAEPMHLIFCEPAGALTGILVCFWGSRKGLLAWIQ